MLFLIFLLQVFHYGFISLSFISDSDFLPKLPSHSRIRKGGNHQCFAKASKLHKIQAILHMVLKAKPDPL